MEYLYDDTASIGRRMREIRRAAHMTQEKLADTMEVSVNYLGEVERGRKPLSRSLADQFCSYFHVTYDYLFHGLPPAYWYCIREGSSYESVQSSLITQLKSCSPDEIVIISQLVGSYLDISRQLQKQESHQDYPNRQQYAAPEKRPPELS